METQTQTDETRDVQLPDKRIETQTDITYNIQIPESKEPVLIIREYEEVKEPEVWENITKRFEVSSWGKVKRDGKIMSQHEHKNTGRLSCHIDSNTREVHTLVAKAFCKNPNKLPIIDHKDRDVSNNYYKNLRFCDKFQSAQNRGPIMGQRFKGVTQHSTGSGWVASCTNRGESQYYWSLSELECAHWYDAKAKELHEPDFRYLNFQDKSVQTY
jgi:hypothetical protein